MTGPSKARAEYDPMAMGVRIAVRRDRHYLTWERPGRAEVGEGSATMDDSAWLRLDEDDARAIYEALTDYFGHSGHDTRALRKDYDAERARVDRLIGFAIGGQS